MAATRWEAPQGRLLSTRLHSHLLLLKMLLEERRLPLHRPLRHLRRHLQRHRQLGTLLRLRRRVLLRVLRRLQRRQLREHSLPLRPRLLRAKRLRLRLHRRHLSCFLLESTIDMRPG